MAAGLDGAGRVTKAVPSWVDLLERCRYLPAATVPEVIDDGARWFAEGARIYLVDFAQSELRPLDSAPTIRIDDTTAGRAFQTGTVHQQSSTVWQPLVDGSDRIGVLGVRFGADADIDWASCSALATVATELLVTKNLYGDTFKMARARRELNLAAAMQWQLLPPLTAATDRISIAGQLEPAYEVGGDVFDYAVNGDCLHLALLDAVGHGVRASTIAALATGVYRHGRHTGMDPSSTLVLMDDAIAVQFGEDAFVTALLAELDARTGTLRWANAGHPRPLLVRHRSVIGELPCHPNPPVGLRLARSFPDDSTVLQPGDRVFFYTDGAIEARLAGREFGLDRLVHFLERELADDVPPAETMRRLARSLLEHHQGRLDDDATMLLIGWDAERPP